MFNRYSLLSWILRAVRRHTRWRVFLSLTASGQENSARFQPGGESAVRLYDLRDLSFAAIGEPVSPTRRSRREEPPRGTLRGRKVLKSIIRSVGLMGLA